MNEEKDLHYVDTDGVVSAALPKEPKTMGVLSLVFGILSIILLGIIGIVLGALARKFASPILLDFADTASAKLAKIGKITGTVGLILSIIGVAVCICASTAIGILVLVMLNKLIPAEGVIV